MNAELRGQIYFKTAQRLIPELVRTSSSLWAVSRRSLSSFRSYSPEKELNQSRQWQAITWSYEFLAPEDSREA